MKALKRIIFGYLALDVILYTLIGVDYYLSKTNDTYGEPDLAKFLCDSAVEGKKAIKSLFDR